jgi:hypothetical protein
VTEDFLRQEFPYCNLPGIHRVSDILDYVKGIAKIVHVLMLVFQFLPAFSTCCPFLLFQRPSSIPQTTTLILSHGTLSL